MRKPISLMKALFLSSFMLSMGISIALFRLNDGFFSIVSPLLQVSGNYPISNDNSTIVDQVLSKPLTYLNAGGQCFVFLSHDGNYVLKIPKYYKFFGAKKTKLINSFWIAGTTYKEATASVYVQVTANPLITTKKTTLIDKMGRAHQVNLSKIPFVIQKRLTPTYQHLHTLLSQEKWPELQESIKNLITSILASPPEGITNRDLIISRNFGFLGTHGYKLDIGGFAFDDRPEESKKFYTRSQKEIKKLRIWTEKNIPSFLPAFDLAVENQLKIR